MTRLSLTQRGERRVLHAQDHAPDIRVCAAVSALTDALDIFLHNAPGVYLEAEALGSGEMYLSFWGGGGAGPGRVGNGGSGPAGRCARRSGGGGGAGGPPRAANRPKGGRQDG